MMLVEVDFARLAQLRELIEEELEEVWEITALLQQCISNQYEIQGDIKPFLKQLQFMKSVQERIERRRDVLDEAETYLCRAKANLSRRIDEGRLSTRQLT